MSNLIQSQEEYIDCYGDKQVIIKLHNEKILTISKELVHVFKDYASFAKYEELMADCDESTDDKIEELYSSTSDSVVGLIDYVLE